MTADDLEHGELGDAIGVLLAMIRSDAIAEIERFAPAFEPGFVECFFPDGSSVLFNVGGANLDKAALMLATAAQLAGHMEAGTVH